MSISKPNCLICQGLCRDVTGRVVPFVFQGFDLYVTFSFECDLNRAKVRQVEFKKYCFRSDRIVLEFSDLERLSGEVWNVVKEKEEMDPNYTWRLPLNDKVTMELYQKECKDFLSTLSLLMTLYY